MMEKFFHPLVESWAGFGLGVRITIDASFARRWWESDGGTGNGYQDLATLTPPPLHPSPSHPMHPPPASPSPAHLHIIV